ncbi:NusG domain II-containing protein [Thiohalorhabdus sp.]|uniref:NusG domain II-containing protein n=1 Tax=Thiohalorhabdus sp. TaxID=3094134 RepID=UPI002FC2BF1A
MTAFLRFLREATTPADRLVLAAAWTGMVILAATAWSAPAGQEVVVIVAGEEVRRLDLDREQRITVDGRQGSTELRVADGGVRFTHAPCSAKRCVRSGWQHRAGASAACVPNKVMVRVAGTSEQGWDAVNY